jgi:hypothetical protein
LPTITLPPDELDALIAAVRGVIEDDRFPLPPRLDPLRAVLARLETAAEPAAQPHRSAESADLKPKAPVPAKAAKRARR